MKDDKVHQPTWGTDPEAYSKGHAVTISAPLIEQFRSEDGEQAASTLSGIEWLKENWGPFTEGELLIIEASARQHELCIAAGPDSDGFGCGPEDYRGDHCWFFHTEANRHVMLHILPGGQEGKVHD